MLYLALTLDADVKAGTLALDKTNLQIAQGDLRAAAPRRLRTEVPRRAGHALAVRLTHAPSLARPILCVMGRVTTRVPRVRFDAATGVNHERTTLRSEGGEDAEHDLWTTCFTPRELTLLAEEAGLVVRDVDAMVLPDTALSDNLLGLSFLSRLKRFEYASGRLVLEQ